MAKVNFNYFGMMGALFLLSANGKSADEGCKSPKSFDYLLANTQTYYSKDYACFFATFNEMANAIKKDGKSIHTKKFLSLAGALSGNAELREAYSEVIEIIAVNQTDFFLKSVHKLDKDSRGILAAILKDPLFTNKEELQKLFQPYLKNPNYKSFLEKTR